MKKTFYYRDERSDKEYTIEIRPALGGLCHVDFAFGRRGGTQQTGRRTKTPVSQTAAEAIFAAMERERLNKGYLEGSTAAEIQYVAELPADAPAGRIVDVQIPAPSRVAPMLLNAITPDEALNYIASDDWFMQPKFDGDRAQLVKKGTSVRAYSRPGLPMSVPAAVLEAALAFPRDFSIDGEMVDGIFVAFDILEDGALNLSRERCQFRAEHVQKLWETSGGGGILASPLALDIDSKQMFFDMIRSQGGEGVVFKRKDAPYSSGRPGSGGDALKCKFWATASVIVGKPHASKSSVEMRLCDDRFVGWLTIHPQYNIRTGERQIIEVRYLDCDSKTGYLKQASFQRIRTDIDHADCNDSQLHVKGSLRAS